MIPVPDLLESRARLGVPREVLLEILELAFLGKDTGNQIDDLLARSAPSATSWAADQFVDDLFLDDLIEGCFGLWLDGREYATNQVFLRSALSHPPAEIASVHLRQEILAELASDPEIGARFEDLYRQLFHLKALFKSPRQGAGLDMIQLRLDICRQVRQVVDQMAEDFRDARSGLRRLHEVGVALHGEMEYRTLLDLLDYHDELAGLTLDVKVGADGRISKLQIRDLEENRENRFYRSPLQRWLDRGRLLFRGYPLNGREVMNRLLHQVFTRVATFFVPLFQVLSHAEFYLTALAFRRRAADLGLEVSIPTVEAGSDLALEEVFNPLLMRQGRPPIPCSLAGKQGVLTVVTGPNSGGKTRLLQAIALTQLLGQAGFYVPAAAARIPFAPGLFVSLVETEDVDQTEGRLGRELMRIRSLFESIEFGAVLVVDELCSGTNPSEGTAIFTLVLNLLSQIEPVGFITTHFLDHARELERQPPVPGLEFLQVEIDRSQSSTYQFVPGVAESSLAEVTAQRLGVTLEELTTLVDRVRKPATRQA